MTEQLGPKTEKEGRPCLCGHTDLEHAYRKFTGYLDCELCGCVEYRERVIWALKALDGLA